METAFGMAKCTLATVVCFDTLASPMRESVALGSMTRTQRVIARSTSTSPSPRVKKGEADMRRDLDSRSDTTLPF